MKNKIYSKKTFWFGIFLLTLSFSSIILLLVRFDDMNGIRILKSLINLVLTTIIGFGFVQESLSYKQTKEAEQEQDEREEFITLKSDHASLIMIQIASFILMVAAIIIWNISKVNELIFVVIAFALIFNLTLFSKLFTYLYYNKKI